MFSITIYLLFPSHAVSKEIDTKPALMKDLNLNLKNPEVQSNFFYTKEHLHDWDNAERKFHVIKKKKVLGLLWKNPLHNWYLIPEYDSVSDENGWLQL